jgi:hypothetical protein
MIPSGVKDGKVYSIKPTDGSGDFTFSRGTDTATRVNSSGLIEKERMNLLLQSNNFNTNWTNYNTSETGGQSGYDGSSDAWLLDKTGASGSIYQTYSVNGVYTFSVYAKAGTDNWIRLTFLALADAYFDLQNGVVGSHGGVSSSIESVGGGWYRCSFSVNGSSGTGVSILPAEGNGSISASSGSIYIQDAQLEQGLVARTYIDTTTAAVYEGITDNLPRLDYSGGASCPSLLLEPQRTNLLPHSEDFSDFSLAGGSLTANDTTSPEGFVNAYKFTEDSANSQHRLRKDFAVSAGEHTISLFVKGTSRYLSMYPQTAATAYAVFDLQNETITQSGGANYVSSSIENYGNDWYRIILTCTASASTLKVHFYLSNSGTAEAPTYVGDGSSYLHFYGAQVEAGSYPTSYIPTMGVSATRAKDSINQNIQSITNGWTEGTLFIEFVKPNTGENNDVMRLRGSGTLGRAYIYNYGVGFASDWGTSQNFTIGENTKVAWRLNSLSDGVEFLNGNKGVGASGTAWSDIRQFRFNEDGAGGVLHIKQILLFPTALTDAECITLTTL